MFDIFGRKKIKELKGDIKTLYTLYENLERSINENRVFDSFMTNKFEFDCFRVTRMVEPEFEEISVKSVLGMVLEKMGLKIGYTPSRKELVREIPSEFKLVKRG